MPPDTSPQANLSTQIYGAKALYLMAGTVSRELATFSSWMIAGAGAIFALALNGVDKLGAFLTTANIGGSIRLFLIAAVLNVLQRWGAAMIAGSTAVATELANAPMPDDIEMAELLRLLEKSTPWPMRSWVRRVIKKTMAGDFLVGARMNVHLSHVQSTLLLLQFLLVFVAAWRLV